MSDHEFEYECSNGHLIFSAKPINKCPMARCESTLTALGAGSREENRRLQSQ